MLAVATAISPARALAGEAAAGPLVFAGAGPNLAITGLLVEAFGRQRPDIRIEIPGSLGSSGGIQAVADGAIAVGLVVRPLSEREKGLGLTFRPYARTAVILGAHPTVPDDGLTADELVQIYRGTKTRWKDGREIIVLTRQPGDSVLEVLAREISGFKDAYDESQRAKRWITLYTSQEMARVLSRTSYALGLTDLGTISAERLPIKVLKLNGVLPTPETIRSGRYPVVLTLAFVFREGALPPGAKAFLDFVRSKEADKILQASGYLPGE